MFKSISFLCNVVKPLCLTKAPMLTNSSIFKTNLQCSDMLIRSLHTTSSYQRKLTTISEYRKGVHQLDEGTIGEKLTSVDDIANEWVRFFIKLECKLLSFISFCLQTSAFSIYRNSKYSVWWHPFQRIALHKCQSLKE